MLASHCVVALVVAQAGVNGTGSQASFQASIDQAVAAYQAGNYAKSLSLLQHLHQEFGRRDVARFFARRHAGEREQRLRAPDRITHDAPRLVHLDRLAKRRAL